MLKWNVQIRTVEAGKQVVKRIPCYSYCQAINEAQKIWDNYSVEEKKVIELSVVLITTEETKYIRKNEVILECNWYYHSHFVVDTKGERTTECFDNYKQAKDAINSYALADKKNGTYERNRYQIQDKNQDIIDYPCWITIWQILNYIEDANMSMSLVDFSRKYGIPYRTLQNWNLEINEPTDYLLGLIAKEVMEYWVENYKEEDDE